MKSTQVFGPESSNTWITENGNPIDRVIVTLPSGGSAIYTNTDLQSGKIQFSEKAVSLYITPATGNSLNRLDRLLSEIGYMRPSSQPVAG
jgi:hypothetical protein